MMKIADFEQARIALEKYIHKGRIYQGRQGLDSMKAFMAYLDNPQEKFRVIHVAGTSGKTSTCYYLNSLLMAGGKRVGLTVSPHVDTINERVQINGRPVAEAEFCRELGSFLGRVESSKIELNYFQVLVAFAYWYFAKAGVEFAVVETGFGGLLDSTNIIVRSDKICVITDIGYDHMHILGDTIAAISAQKAGIMHEGNQAFMHTQDREVLDVMRARATEVGADLHVLNGSDTKTEVTQALPLFQQRNWSLAFYAYRWLSEQGDLSKLSSAEIERSFTVNIPARMEHMTIGGKTVIFDGAHNGQKIEVLAASMSDRYAGQPIAVLLSMAANPSFRDRANLQPLMKIADEVIVTSFGGAEDGPKHSVDPKELAECCRESGASKVEVIEPPEAAMQALLNKEQPILLVTGSFYLMNHTRHHLLQ